MWLKSNSPHYFMFTFLFLLLPHHDRLDYASFLRCEVRHIRQIRHRGVTTEDDTNNSEYECDGEMKADVPLHRGYLFILTILDASDSTGQEEILDTCVV